jgi:hypothetical protein
VNEEQAGAMSEQKLNGLVRRLQGEKEEFEKADFDNGRQRGFHYAATASYAEFLDYAREAEAQSGFHGRGQDQCFTLSDWEEAHLDDLLNEGKVADPQAFRAGWLEALMEVWAQVEARI